MLLLQMNKFSKSIIFLLNYYVFKYLYIYLIIIGLILLVIPFVGTKKSKINRIRKVRKSELFFKIITYPICLFAKIISPKSEQRKERYRKNFLTLGINTTVERFHILKALMPIIFIILFYLIHTTNVTYELRSLLNNKSKSQMDITNEDEDLLDKMDEEKELKDIDIYEIYRTIKVSYGDYNNIERFINDYNRVEQKLNESELGFDEKQAIRDRFNNERQEIIDGFVDVISENYSISEENALYISEHLVKNIPQITAITYFSYEYYLISLISIYLPNIILMIMNAFKYKRYKEDIEILKITTLVLGTIEGITVKKLLESLKEVSPSYKNIINIALNNYSSIQSGKEDAIMGMTEDVELSQFRKLCSILKEISSGNKSSAINNLEADMILEDKENEMISNDRIEKKTWVAVLIIGPTILLIMLLFLMPFSQYYQSINF